MSDQHTVAQIQIDRDDLERSQDAIHEAQHDLDALLEQMEQSLDAEIKINQELCQKDNNLASSLSLNG